MSELFAQNYFTNSTKLLSTYPSMCFQYIK